MEVVVTTNETLDSKHRVGLITEAIAQDIQGFHGWRAYVCGAPPMVEATATLLKQRGIDEQRVYADAFYASST
jgi:ferredoxin-NAD(P)+ reductase (naphthalene dioxygenase ferredoxin-specific)